MDNGQEINLGRERLARQLAEAVAEALRDDLRERDQVLLVVSGGSTPVPFFKALATKELPWERVQVTLADERWVSPQSSDSNARLVREHLLVDAASTAAFVSLHTDDATPEQGVQTVTERLDALAWPASVVVLGMGDDGHTASLFPDSRELELALTQDAAAIAVHSPSQPQPRISLSAARLGQSRRHLLHLNGENKRAVLHRALASDDVRELPIRLFLRYPLAIYWAP